MAPQEPRQPLTLLAATLLGCGSNLILVFCIGLCWGLVFVTYATSPSAPENAQTLYERILVGAWGVPLLANAATVAWFGLRQRWDIARGFLPALALSLGLLGISWYMLTIL